MNRRYWAEIDGERIYRASLDAVKRIAQDTADKLGRVVRVGYEDRPARKANPAPKGAYVVAWTDSLHRPAHVRFPTRAAARAAVRAKRDAGFRDARLALRKNPVLLDIPAYAQAEDRARRGRLNFLAATKARRLAKGLRGRDRGGAVKAAERRAAKTGKFAVHVAGATINGVRQPPMTLYRASRASADALGAGFEAAGYKVTIAPV